MEVPQIIQSDHDLVLKPVVTWGSFISKSSTYIYNSEVDRIFFLKDIPILLQYSIYSRMLINGYLSHLLQ